MEGGREGGGGQLLSLCNSQALTGTLCIPSTALPPNPTPKKEKNRSLDVAARNDSPHPLACKRNTGHFNEEEWPQFSET